MNGWDPGPSVLCRLRHLDQLHPTGQVVPLIVLRWLGLCWQLVRLGGYAKFSGRTTRLDIRSFDIGSRSLVVVDRVGVDIALNQVEPEAMRLFDGVLGE
jgi:hypothetical protein